MSDEVGGDRWGCLGALGGAALLVMLVIAIVRVRDMEKVERLYEGPQRPKSEIAVIELGGDSDGVTVEIDEKAIVSRTKPVEVLPGDHSVKVSRSETIGGRQTVYAKTTTLNAKAGHRYVVKYFINSFSIQETANEDTTKDVKR